VLINSLTVELFGYKFAVMDIGKLILAKRAAESRAEWVCFALADGPFFARTRLNRNTAGTHRKHKKRQRFQS
jgi:hypothetical protein